MTNEEILLYIVVGGMALGIGVPAALYLYDRYLKGLL